MFLCFQFYFLSCNFRFGLNWISNHRFSMWSQMSELDHMFELDQCNLSYFNSGRCLPE